ncbi:hypothetical protein ABXJ56_14800 [Microbacterium chocolatum]|uniref:hypothetical protein n=1 Tax=Microbacterium aurantiacum TaxID=162393 RepID=UPI00339073DC
MTRGAGTILLALVTGALLAGCTPEPSTPTPTPTFTSDDDAFAAAEATYRAYVDALNQVDLSDPATFEPVYAWTTGELNASDRTTYSEWHAEGYQIVGEASISSLRPATSTSRQTATLLITSCYDVSDVDVLDASGSSLVDESRPGIQWLEVELVQTGGTTTGLALRSIGPASGESPCSS